MEEGGLDRVYQLVKTHLDMGGTLININVLDKDKPVETHKNPMLYLDLIFRVTGFTVCFAALSKEFRQLIVDKCIDDMYLDSN